MNILAEILANKKRELALRRERYPQAPSPVSRRYISLKAALISPGASGIIAEFKRRSPSRGWLFPEGNAGSTARAYEAGGACGMSVLTDEVYFGGSLEDLRQARQSCGLPLLRKDFIIDEYQVFEAQAMGADIILLIAECLDRDRIRDLAVLAHALGLEVLLELHGASQLDKICPEVDLVGINNRNLETFEVDIRNSLELAPRIPREFIRVAESGISTQQSILELRNQGFDGFLLGEHFMKQRDPGMALGLFVAGLKDLGGLKSGTDPQISRQ